MERSGDLSPALQPCQATPLWASLVLAYSHWSRESWAAHHRGNAENQKCDEMCRKVDAVNIGKPNICHAVPAVSRLSAHYAYWILLDSIGFLAFICFSSNVMAFQRSRIQGILLWLFQTSRLPLSVSSFWKKQKSTPTHLHILQRNFHWPSGTRSPSNFSSTREFMEFHLRKHLC